MPGRRRRRVRPWGASGSCMELSYKSAREADHVIDSGLRPRRTSGIAAAAGIAPLAPLKPSMACLYSVSLFWAMRGPQSAHRRAWCASHAQQHGTWRRSLLWPTLPASGLAAGAAGAAGTPATSRGCGRGRCFEARRCCGGAGSAGAGAGAGLLREQALQQGFGGLCLSPQAVRNSARALSAMTEEVFSWSWDGRENERIQGYAP